MEGDLERDQERTRVFVVYRCDPWGDESSRKADPNTWITIKEVLPSEEMARREVDRLSGLSAGLDRPKYYWQSSWFLSGPPT